MDFNSKPAGAFQSHPLWRSHLSGKEQLRARLGSGRVHWKLQGSRTDGTQNFEQSQWPFRAAFVPHGTGSCLNFVLTRVTTLSPLASHSAEPPRYADRNCPIEVSPVKIQGHPLFKHGTCTSKRSLLTGLALNHTHHTLAGIHGGIPFEHIGKIVTMSDKSKARATYEVEFSSLSPECETRVALYSLLTCFSQVSHST